jgi:hypothetical protein
MRKNHIRGALLALAALVALPAGAQEPILGEGPAKEIARRSLTLDRGKAELWAPVTMNLTRGQGFEPVNVNPSLYYGVTDNFMIGVRHFTGFCVTGEENGCPNLYNDVSVDALVAFGRGTGIELGAGGALNWAPIDGPNGKTAVSGEARVVARAGGGAFALTLSPTVNFGLNERGGQVAKTTGTPLNLASYNVLTPTVSPGNREYLLVPVTLQLQLGSLLTLAAGASLNGPLDAEDLDFGDAYTVPVSFAAVVTPFPKVDVGAAFVFPNLGGADFSDDEATFTVENGWDQRQLSIFAAFRL